MSVNTWCESRVLATYFDSFQTIDVVQFLIQTCKTNRKPADRWYVGSLSLQWFCWFAKSCISEARGSSQNVLSGSTEPKQKNPKSKNEQKESKSYKARNEHLFCLWNSPAEQQLTDMVYCNKGHSVRPRQKSMIWALQE